MKKETIQIMAAAAAGDTFVVLTTIMLDRMFKQVRRCDVFDGSGCDDDDEGMRGTSTRIDVTAVVGFPSCFDSLASVLSVEANKQI